VCGELSTNIDITFEITNLGDLRVGPGLVVVFRGIWSNPQLNEPLYADAGQTDRLSATITTSIEPGASILLSVNYDVSYNSRGELPARIRVFVDNGNQARECDESNNAAIAAVDPGGELPDLRLVLGEVDNTACPAPTVETTLYNEGSESVSDVTIHYYAGDPAQGGTYIHEEVVTGPIDPGDSVNFVAVLDNFPKNLHILVYGIADPDDEIEECNNANNKDPADDTLYCFSGIE
jgi:hypothetical protein